MNLTTFLNNKTLYYDKIDYDVISLSWDILKKHIKLPYVIHIVGTNGKGTTGRFLASFLVQLGKKTLHYTSPHILKFNERIWINGKNSSDTELNNAHRHLQQILSSDLLDRLTYFEYTTLLAILISSGFDYIVLEAGLGGEFDATNVIESDLSIFTTIGLDHQEFLGDNIESIAQTKMRSCNNSYIISKQIYNEVYKIEKEILSKYQNIEYNNIQLPKQATTLPTYLQDNLKTALNVLVHLKLPITNLTLDKLPSRFEYIANNIIVDVGHNPLAAKVIYNELKKQDQKIILIYNSYKDKDYKEVLTILKPIINKVEIIECKDERIVDKMILKDTLDTLDIKFDDFDINNIKDDLYLVFGSFLVVESFLKQYNQNVR